MSSVPQFIALDPMDFDAKGLPSKKEIELLKQHELIYQQQHQTAPPG